MNPNEPYYDDQDLVDDEPDITLRKAFGILAQSAIVATYVGFSVAAAFVGNIPNMACKFVCKKDPIA